MSDFLKNEISQYTRNIVLPLLEKATKNDFPEKKFNFELSDDGENLRVHYPSLFESESSFLQSNVFVEFGSRNSVEPNDKLRIKTIICDLVKDVEFPTAEVNVLSPLRTFWE